MFQKRIPKVTLCCLLIIHIQASGYTVQSQDQTSSRTNTLFDDADDIQRQLDNEARDRIKFGRPKTIWVFHFPTHFTDQNGLVDPRDERTRYSRDLAYKKKQVEDGGGTTVPLPPSQGWSYNDQGKWSEVYPECGGKSQSPVDLPTSGLIKSRGARSLLFQNYDVAPKTLTVMKNGGRVVLFGDWKSGQRPLIYGGAAHSRRYLFQSLTIHAPAEHTVGMMQYPLETQALYVSAEYKDMQHALDGCPSDPQAFLAVASLYKFSNHTHKGIQDLLAAAKITRSRNESFVGKPLSHYIPPFKEYAVYQGSMTMPPCTESVLWLIRGRSLSIERESFHTAASIIAPADAEPKFMTYRTVQPLNDRKVYLFK